MITIMHGYCSQEKKRPGHLSPFLADLRRRAGLSQMQVGARIGTSQQPVYLAENSTRGASLNVALSIARVCGATPEELERVHRLYGLDRGMVPLKPGATEADAVAAIGAMKGAWRNG